MKALGAIACAGAAVTLFVGFTKDVSVATMGGDRVNNIGLMSDRQNIIIAGSGLLIAGGLLLGLSGRGGRREDDPGMRKCPSCAEIVKAEATVCRFCQRDLPRMDQLSSQEQEAQAAALAAGSLMGAAREEAEANLPRGTCPNCSVRIPLASAKCRHCDAEFGPGSAWTVKPF